LAAEVIPDCAIDAVENPEVAGPINAIGAIKHPDSSVPSVVKINNLLIIESPLYFVFYYICYFCLIGI
jgi:hypothetical protein